MAITCIMQIVVKLNTEGFNENKSITKTCLYHTDPLKHHFYIIKTGIYRGKHDFSYFSCEYSLEPPWQCGSNEWPQSMFYVLSRNMTHFRIVI